MPGVSFSSWQFCEAEAASLDGQCRPTNYFLAAFLAFLAFLATFLAGFFTAFFAVFFATFFAVFLATTRPPN